jgi:hypothetical protein
VRLSFIDALRQFDPLDARILKERNDISGAPAPNAIDNILSRIPAQSEQIFISVQNFSTPELCYVYSINSRFLPYTFWARSFEGGGRLGKK